METAINLYFKQFNTFCHKQPFKDIYDLNMAQNKISSMPQCTDAVSQANIALTNH